MIKALLLFGVLGAFSLISQPRVDAQAVDPPVVQILFAWKDCQIEKVIDLNDFDLDRESGEKRYVITSLVYECLLDRDVTFDFRPSDGVKRTTVVASGIEGAFFIPITSRVTEENFSWNFTPAHVDVRPGSVSAPSLLTSGGNETANGSDASASFTPTANSLLVVGWSTHSTTGNPTHTFTNSHAGSGAWTAINHVVDTSPTFRRHSQGYSQVGGSPGAGTVTNTYSVNKSTASWIISEITGHNSSTPVSESLTGGSDVGTTLTLTLGGIAAGNMAVGSMLAGGQASITVGANETELAEATSGATNTRTQMEYGNSDNVINWSWASSARNAGAAIEYAQAAAGATAQVIMID